MCKLCTLMDASLQMDFQTVIVSEAIATVAEVALRSDEYSDEDRVTIALIVQLIHMQRITSNMLLKSGDIDPLNSVIELIAANALMLRNMLDKYDAIADNNKS